MKNKYVRTWILIVAAIFLLALVGIGALRVYSDSRLHRAVARYQKDVGALTGQTYTLPPILETNNIATWMNAGANALVITTDERNNLLSNLLSTPYEKWDSNSKTQFREILKRNKQALKLLDRMGNLTQSSFGLTYTNGLDMEIPNLYVALQARKLLACKWRMDLAEGEIAEVARAATALERMAAALEHEPLLISTLVGHVSEKENHELIQSVLPKADVGMLSQFSQQLQHLRQMAVPIHTVLAAKGSMTYWSLNQSGLRDVFENSEQKASNLRRWILVDRRLVMAASMETYADLVRTSKMPITINADQPLPVGLVLGPSRIWRELLVELAYSAIERHQATESARILAELAVAVCGKGRVAGEYPKTLSEFSTAKSPYTGESVQYQLQKDGSATLSFPKADQLWDKRMETEPPSKPKFVWNLPKISG